MGITIPTTRILAGEVFKSILPTLNFEPVQMAIKNGKLVLSLRVFDPDGNLIAEVKNNHWRPNRNFYGYFNYDSKGFEVLDNQGNIAVSIDVVSNNRVSIQGIFRSINHKTMVIAAGKDLRITEFRNPEARNHDPMADQLIASINPLFEYFGPGWLHKRVKEPVKILENSFFDPEQHLDEKRPPAEFDIRFDNIAIVYNGVSYQINVSSVDPFKPERVLFRIANWQNNPGTSRMMLEKSGGKNGDLWKNSRPMDVHDPGFIDAAIKALDKLIVERYKK